MLCKRGKAKVKDPADSEAPDQDAQKKEKEGDGKKPVSLRETWHEYTEFTGIEGVLHSFDRNRPIWER